MSFFKSYAENKTGKLVTDIFLKLYISRKQVVSDHLIFNILW